ncbi:MAG TPA: methylenetetrahydrofolate reductase [NAD(P)H] [Elusimicrobiota bacterium]|nr:methylenetetrahydrofolate reductase [NAD(P)H] [Elusimicrobiota bacterium]
MKIPDILAQKRPAFSFEFFPPKTDEDAAHLLATARQLKELDPAFISVTWGAGGSTRRKTLDIVSAVKKDLGVETMAHLTCVGASREDIDGVLAEIRERGIKNVLALRGDPPKGSTAFVTHPGGFAHANELVAHIKRFGDFSVGVAGYPEKHVEAPSLEADLDHLKRKVDAGADFIITQLFFGNDDFLRFRDKAAARGIALPILPGLMPVTNVGQLKRFTTLCGTKIPADLLQRLEAVQDDAEAVIRLGVAHAVSQGRRLLDAGVPGIHFFTLNRSRSTADVLKTLRAR